MSKQVSKKNLAVLPSVESVLKDDRIASFFDTYSHDYVAFVTRSSIDLLRQDLKNGKFSGSVSREYLTDNLIRGITAHFSDISGGSLVPAVNATGVILHTGLGRAPLSPLAAKHVRKILKGYSTLEIDRETGSRGQRERRLNEIFCFLTGAESGTIVNNNAAAVLLTLNTLAKDKEVIISRGELVEIGGSFRMPDIMAASGAKMVEVGTTNKTNLSDYQMAITRKTGAILKVHSSNFRVMGFSESVSLNDLSALCSSKKIPLIYDLGGGVIFDLKQFGLPSEPVAPDSVKSGASIVMFSGDKVLGGPQSGIIVGKSKYVDAIKKNPIARTVRCDKLVIAALEGTMISYLSGSKGFKSLPSTRMMLEPPNKLEQMANEVVSLCNKPVKKELKIEIEQSRAEFGSGAVPLEDIPSYAVSLQSEKLKPEKIAKLLRIGDPPVFGYIKNDKVYLDMRTVFPDQIPVLVHCINSLYIETGKS